MDDSEKLVAAYLAHAGHTHVVHHPDGKHNPPDFLVDGRIAVEVRRLNQNEQTTGVLRGLEEVTVPLNLSVRSVLASLGPPTNGVSWFVSYWYRRPLPPAKELQRKLKHTLADLVGRGLRDGTTMKVAPGFTVQIHRASQPHAQQFVFGHCVDEDYGQLFLRELKRNLKICIAEKSHKVSRVKAKYPLWWLALVDQISFGCFNRPDRAHLRAVFAVEDPWTKIILVSPFDPSQGFEL
jgi:hypothetical protein